MNQIPWREQWLAEERAAHIHGWDFSHLDGRYDEERDLPWRYDAAVRAVLTEKTRLLDIDTGGGEFLLSLNHPHRLTAATEAYPPNVRLCREVLTPLGVDFREADGGGALPFPDASFDLVINRHGDFNPEEIVRVLAPGGTFVTEQVGAENDRELVALLLDPPPPLPFPEQRLTIAKARLEAAGMTVVRAEEAFRPICFFDVGALVWFARVLPWEFPGFSVDTCLERLCLAQERLMREGALTGRIHRYLLVSGKGKP